MNFFQYQAQIPYTFLLPNGETTTLRLTNITQRAVLSQRIRAVVDTYYDYFIAEGERPDTVANKLYGHSKYTWLVLLINNISSLFEWPLTGEEFSRMLLFKYGSLTLVNDASPDAGFYYFTRNKQRVTAWEYSQLSAVERGEVFPSQYCFTAAGAPIDFDSYYHLPLEQRGNIQTPYEYEMEINEAKRRIKIVNAQLLPVIDREYRTVFQG